MKDGLASLQHKNLDEESVFAEDEKAAALDDNSRYTEYQNLILFFFFFLLSYHTIDCTTFCKISASSNFS